MSDPVQLAKAARETLAAALNALQTADVPDELVDAAEPVAQAMGVLHRIERTNGANLDGRDEALEHVRSALGRVQRVESTHPAVERVMEAIAEALTGVLALARYVPPQAPAPLYGGPASGPTPRAPAEPQPAPPAYAKPPPPVIAPQHAQPVYAGAASAPVYGGTPRAAAEPFYGGAASGPTPQFAPQPMPVAAPQPAPRAPAPQPAAPRAVPADRPSQPAGGSKVDVELGTHSASNFYKGLGGNDVIEHGGIFVATYKMLKINTPVTLRVLLPGDYEFIASAVVQWTREGGSSEPGYGARFTQISPEGRQLVYRYTRNREPMFYDDL
jgi:hypothetical protein